MMPLYDAHGPNFYDRIHISARRVVFLFVLQREQKFYRRQDACRILPVKTKWRLSGLSRKGFFADSGFYHFIRSCKQYVAMILWRLPAEGLHIPVSSPGVREPGSRTGDSASPVRPVLQIGSGLDCGE